MPRSIALQQKNASHQKSGRLHQLAGLCCFFLVYVASAKFGLRFGSIHDVASLIWPPAGISLGGLLIFGPHLWPGIALGALFVNLQAGATLPVALGVAAGCSIEAVLGTLFLRNIGFDRRLERLRDVVGLILLAAILSTFVGATIGTATLYLGGAISEGESRFTWLSWWYGDMMGDLVIAPMLLVWSSGIRWSWNPRQMSEGILLISSTVLGGFVFLSDWVSTEDTRFGRPFFIFPILMLVAVRLGQRATVTGIFLVALITLGATVLGHGRFLTGSLNESLLQAQIFLVVVAVSKMVLASVVTERRRERDALKASNAEKEAILNASLDPIVTMNHLGRIIEFNRAAESTFGYRREEVIGGDMASFIIPPRFREAHRKGLERYLQTRQGPVLGKKLELPAVRADGTEFPSELSIVPLDVEGQPMFTGFIQDITDKKRSEESDKFLIEATEKISSSIDYPSTLKHVVRALVPAFADYCVVQILDEETGRFQAVEYSSAAPGNERLFQEYIGRYLSGLGGTGVSSAVFRTKKPHLVTDLRDGTETSIIQDKEQLRSLTALGVRSILAIPLFLRGHTLGAISVASALRAYDESDRMLMEEFARRSVIALENAKLYSDAQEAIHSRDEFLSVASHELKTPLTSLSLQIQMLSRWFQNARETGDVVSLPMRIAKNIPAIEMQIRKLGALLDELLDLTRIRLGRIQLEREEMDFSELVREVADRFRAEAVHQGSALTVGAAPSAIGCWDRIRVEQVISNLISNALKYGEGKPVSVTVEKDEEKRLVRLVVRDQGMGVPREMQEKIFQRFERAGISGKKISGLGLGLYISRQITEAHGGTIRVESEAGGGSTFIAEFPIDIPQERAA